MDRSLLDKYFTDRCSSEERAHVLEWLGTPEGRVFLHADFDRQARTLAETGDLFLGPPIDSERLFRRIQRHKTRPRQSRWWFPVRVAAIFLVVAVLSAGLYWSGVGASQKQPPRPAFATYQTGPGQQQVLTLSGGVTVRLAANSTLRVATHFRRNRTVALEGQAYFQVAHDRTHPFVVRVGGVVIKDLGTRFDVRADSAAGATWGFWIRPVARSPLKKGTRGIPWAGLLAAWPTTGLRWAKSAASLNACTA